MSGDVNGFVVILREDIPEGSAGRVMDAIREFANVLSVRPNMVDPVDTIAMIRARGECKDLLIECFDKFSA